VQGVAYLQRNEYGIKFRAFLDKGAEFGYEAHDGDKLLEGDVLQVRSNEDSRARDWYWVEVRGISRKGIFLRTWKR